MDSLCIYPTVFTEQMSMIFFLFCICLFVVFLFVFSVETWSSLPCVHTLHVQQHHSDSQMLLFKVCVLVSRLFSYQNKG